MTLTSAQKATIAANITASPDLVGKTDSAIAALYNAAAVTTFTVWKTLVTITQIGDNLVATELAGLSTLNATRLQTIALFSEGGVNPALADRRAFFDDVFSGAGGALTREKLLILWKRTATRLEKLLATGTGSDASPATLSFEGAVTAQQISDILNGV